MSLEGLGRAYDLLYQIASGLLIAVVVLAPFGIWKIIECIVWIIQHVKVTTT